MLHQLVDILKSRGRTDEDFRALVEKQDEDDPIRSYGLLPVLAARCSRSDGEAASAPNSKKDRLVSELRVEVEAAERLKEKIRGSPKNKAI